MSYELWCDGHGLYDEKCILLALLLFSKQTSSKNTFTLWTLDWTWYGFTIIVHLSKKYVPFWRVWHFYCIIQFSRQLSITLVIISVSSFWVILRAFLDCWSFIIILLRVIWLKYWKWTKNKDSLYESILYKSTV